MPFDVYSGVWIKSCIEIFIIFLFVYGVLRLVQGTRGAGVLKGLTVAIAVMAIVIVVVTRRLRLETVDWLLSSLAPWVLIPLFVLFQPEIRRALIRLGENPLFSSDSSIASLIGAWRHINHDSLVADRVVVSHGRLIFER